MSSPNFSPDQVQALAKIKTWLAGEDPRFFSLMGCAGTGKCLGLDTPVMLHDGQVIPVQYVKAGMSLMGPDSQPRLVTSTNVGTGPLYRVTPTKGDPWVCNDAHILTLAGTNSKMGQTVDVSVTDVLEKEAMYLRDYKLFRVPVVFPERPRPNIDPYLFGAWLGDGSRDSPTITNCEPEILEYCKSIAPTLTLKVSTTWIDKNNTYTIRFKVDTENANAEDFEKSGNYHLVNPLTTLVKRGKRVHEEYLYGSEQTRRETLAGLIDTDGYLAGSCSWDLIIKDDGMADDVAFLCRSLGLAAYLTKKTATIKSLGFTGIYNRISISGDLDSIPCKVPRRKAAPRKQIKRVLVTGFKLEPIGEGDYYGFTLDGDGRFLLGDFTVTHNTTLAKHIAEEVKGTVHFLAFTGKAALVMRRSGCTDAQTIHSLIYAPQERSKKRLTELEVKIAQFPEDGPPEELADMHKQLEMEQKNSSRPMFKLKSDSDLRYAALAIVDECSMIDEQIGSDLLSFGIPILALGDPGQLPPIRGEGHFTRKPPDHLLTEIHRQAKESPIIQMATIVREGGKLQHGAYGHCEVVKQTTSELALGADQIIVGRNKTRKWINNRVRELLGKTGIPQPGDKLVCLRNSPKNGLLNGSQWELLSIDVGDDKAFISVKPWQEEGEQVDCITHMHYFEGRDKDLPWYERKEAEEFDFGYAITAHKSQGSQWENVLVIDESAAFGNDAARHLYTALTRAIQKVTVVL